MPGKDKIVALNENYENALFHMVMSDVAEQEGELLLEESKALNNDQKSSPSEENIKEFTKLLDSQLKARQSDNEDLHESKSMRTCGAPKRKFFRISLIAAIILLMSLLLAAQAAGVNLFKLIGTWTEETFHLTTGADIPEEGDPTASITNGKNAEGDYGSLSDALKDNGIPVDSIPSWWPTGYALEDLEVSQIQDMPIIYALYENGSKSFTFSIRKLKTQVDDSTIYEKDGEQVIQYEKNGITHYILSNINTMQAVWADDSTIYTISGQLSTSEIEKMVDSIYKR